MKKVKRSKKKMEEMSRDEVLAEFEGEEPIYYMPSRPKNEGLLTMRVPAALKERLCEEAKRRGLKGHTTMARILIEEGLRHSRGKTLRAGGGKRVDELDRKSVV